MTPRGPETQSFRFGKEARLFGFFHPAASARAHGVVLCAPIGDDLVRAHRALRHLADKLSAVGFPVLRFDFDGTGDSASDERAPARAATWLEDVGAAVEELAARSGRKRVVLGGLKFGATLATVAASRRHDVDGLLLWSAYDSGADFVAEAAKVHKMHTMLEPDSFSGGPAASGGLEALGFFFPSPTLDEIRKVDILALRKRPATRAFVIGSSSGPAESKHPEYLARLGVIVETLPVRETRFLITTPHEAKLPEATLEAAVGWVADRFPSSHGEAPAPRRESTARAGSPLASVEVPVRFGNGRPLFGILHKPKDAGRAASRPGILLLNAGTVHRIGPHRTYVKWARRIADLGFPVLRVDLSGIGDSPVAPDAEENLTYPREGPSDVRAAMSFLREEANVTRFILMGLCSGADIAFQLGHREADVAGVVMMNPRTFCVHDLGMVAAHQHANWYGQSLFARASWKKLLQGKVDVRRVVRVLAPRAKDAALARVERTKRALSALARIGPSSPVPELDVPSRLREMATKGVDTFLLVTRNDPGVSYVDAHYGRSMTRLAELPRFRRMDLEGTDHTFTALWAQERVGELVGEHLRTHFRGEHE